MGFDAQELQDLEAIYLASRNPDDLKPLYEKLLIAGLIILRSYMRKKNLFFNSDKVDEVVHDAVCRLLEMYLKHDDQESMPLPARMYLEIIHRLHDRKVRIADELYKRPIPFHHPAEEQATYNNLDGIEEIMLDNRLDGKNIVIDLYRNRYYKRAIKAIDLYTNRNLIYEYAIELRQVWQTLHWED